MQRNNSCLGTMHADEQCIQWNFVCRRTMHAEEQCMEKNNACREQPFNRNGFTVFTADSCRFLNALDAEHVTLFALSGCKSSFRYGGPTALADPTKNSGIFGQPLQNGCICSWMRNHDGGNWLGYIDMGNSIIRRATEIDSWPLLYILFTADLTRSSQVDQSADNCQL